MVVVQCDTLYSFQAWDRDRGEDFFGNFALLPNTAVGSNIEVFCTYIEIFGAVAEWKNEAKEKKKWMNEWNLKFFFLRLAKKFVSPVRPSVGRLFLLDTTRDYM